MLTSTWPPRATSPWTMWRRAPSSSWASCRPSAGRACGAAGGVVEDLGQRADDVVVVVEDLVVVARDARVPAHEDGVGGVDHDLPDVVVVEQRRERPVAGQVAEGPLGDRVGIGERERCAGPAGGRRPSATSSAMSALSLASPAADDISSETSLARSWTSRSISTSGDGVAPARRSGRHGVGVTTPAPSSASPSSADQLPRDRACDRQRFGRRRRGGSSGVRSSKADRSGEGRTICGGRCPVSHQVVEPAPLGDEDRRRRQGHTGAGGRQQRARERRPQLGPLAGAGGRTVHDGHDPVAGDAELHQLAHHPQVRMDPGHSREAHHQDDLGVRSAARASRFRSSTSSDPHSASPSTSGSTSLTTTR